MSVQLIFNVIIGVIVGAVLLVVALALLVAIPLSLVLMVVLLLQLLGVLKKVPFTYNLRNLIVRWRTTSLTAIAFTLVVCLMTVMLAFVNGMYALTNNSGVPTNVLVLADGS
jgi:hypothetical protein